jgi:hypothetical protein
MRRRRYLIPLIVLAVLMAIGLAFFLRKSAPPEPVRLLPEAQAYLYVNLHPARMANIKMASVQLDPDYDQFIKETGFQFERDLDEAAFAVHVPKPGGSPENRFSEVLIGHFENDKVRGYLNRLSARIDSYRDLEVFNIPHEDRMVRVVILGPDMVAVSNVEDPLVVRGIVDRYKKVALPFGGPSLIRRYYHKLPLGTVAWAIADIAHGSKENTSITIPGGFNIFLPPDTVAVASIRYLGSIDFKAEALTTSELAAQRVTDQVNAFLGFFRMLEMNSGDSDPDVKTFFESVKVEQDGKDAILTAELPQGFLKKVLTEPPQEPKAAHPAPEQPAPKGKPKPKRRR